MADTTEVAAEQEIEGVKFTPKASIDMDKVYAESIDQTDKTDKTDTVDTTDQTKTDSATDKKAEDQVSGGDKNTEAKADVTDNKADKKDDEDVNLSEIIVSIGDQEKTVDEIVKDYQSLSQKAADIEKDEFLKNFVEHYLAGGDPEEYLRSSSDPSKVGDLALMRDRFFSDPDNKGFDDDVKEALFERELSEKYGMNPDGSFDDEESKAAKIGKQTMKRDADKVRAEILDRNKKFQIKRREETKKEQPKINPADQLKAISELPQAKDLLAKKSVALEDGVSLPVSNPDEVIGMMADLNKFWDKFRDQKGVVDWGKVTKLMAYAVDPSAYDKHLLSAGSDRGTEAYLKEQKNIGGASEKVIDKSLDNQGLDLNNPVEQENFLKQAIAQKNAKQQRR